MNIKESLEETLNELKIDVDVGNFPEWWRLMRILNFCSLFPDAEIYQTASGGYHLKTASVRSNSDLRKALGDCKGREYCANKRLEMIGTDSDIIFWTGKGKFQYKKVKDKLIVTWTRKRVPDRKITLRDVLALPFWSQIDTHHRISRIKWLKHKKKEEVENLEEEVAKLEDVYAKAVAFVQNFQKLKIRPLNTDNHAFLIT